MKVSAKSEISARQFTFCPKMETAKFQALLIFQRTLCLPLMHERWKFDSLIPAERDRCTFPPLNSLHAMPACPSPSWWGDFKCLIASRSLKFPARAKLVRFGGCILLQLLQSALLTNLVLLRRTWSHAKEWTCSRCWTRGQSTRCTRRTCRPPIQGWVTPNTNSRIGNTKNKHKYEDG